MGVSGTGLDQIGVMGSQVLAYAEFTTDIAPTATSEGGANTVVTAPAVAFDGTTEIAVEHYCSGWAAHNAAGAELSLWLFDNGSSLGRIGYVTAQSSSFAYRPVRIARKLTPSAGSHTYSIRASVSTGTGHNVAGTGGAGNYMPGYIRITRESAIVTGVGIAGVPGGFAPLGSGLLVPRAYLPQIAGLLHNMSASTSPSVNDDSGDGYGVGSRWYNTTLDCEFVCLDATVGAAVWRVATLVTLDAALGANTNFSSNTDLVSLALPAGATWDVWGYVAWQLTSTGPSHSYLQIADGGGAELVSAYDILPANASWHDLSGLFVSAVPGNQTIKLRGSADATTNAKAGATRLHAQLKAAA